MPSTDPSGVAARVCVAAVAKCSLGTPTDGQPGLGPEPREQTKSNLRQLEVMPKSHTTQCIAHIMARPTWHDEAAGKREPFSTAISAS
jgi:hypothetical protein